MNQLDMNRTKSFLDADYGKFYRSVRYKLNVMC